MIWILMSKCCRINEMCTYNCKFHYFSYNFNEFSNICKNSNATRTEPSHIETSNFVMEIVSNKEFTWIQYLFKQHLDCQFFFWNSLLITLNALHVWDGISVAFEFNKRERFCLQHVLVDRVVVELFSSLSLEMKYIHVHVAEHALHSYTQSTWNNIQTNKLEYTRSVG